MIEKIKRACFHSLTMAWAYVQAALGIVLTNLDTLAILLNDPSIKEQVAPIFGGNPKLVGLILSITGIVTAIARARSLLKGNQ